MSRDVISGRKGDDTPSEDPNTLKSIANARVLLALGEGEFEGGIDGKRIFLDGTPLVSKNGTMNFTNVSWWFRPGSVDQEYIAGFPAIESETAIGVELKSDTPWVITLTNSLLSACVIRFRWPALQAQKENGDVVGYSISYRVDVATDGGAFQTVANLNVTGKTTSDYERSVRVDLPVGNSWTVRVVRLTPNQNSNKFADTMYVAAITEVIDRKLRYPNTALLGISFDATQFSNIPQISVLAKLRKIRVPDNYDPETRTYTGIWTGGFKLAYSNNPAWVTYDLIIENRFSIGDKVGPEFVNKYELYKIAQYCDQQVPDGKGGTEHRFECNIYIQTAAEAWQVLRDISAIYRGMVYWMQSQMFVRADMPRDPDYIFTNANVVDGAFTYSGSDERTKFTRALISYDNPDNQYETDVTTTFDSDLQRRYGDNVVELAAYGCTRESEAQRRGKWAIYTNNTDRMVTFRTGMEGEIPLLGDIIAVADELIAGVKIGGRLADISEDGKTLTLDREVELTAGDSVIVNLPSGKAESRSVVSASAKVVEVSLPYSEKPNAHCQWTIDRQTITHQLFQVLSVKKSDTESIEYEISGIEHDPGKFDYVDTGARLEDRPVSNIPVGGQEPPATVSISQSVHVEQTMAVTTMTISWSDTEGAVGYDVQWQKDNGEWVKVPRTGQNSIDVQGVYSGQYMARVRAVNSVGVFSIATPSNLTEITGKEGEPPALALFRTESRAFEIYLDWSFPAGAEDTLYTEVQYSTDAEGTAPILLGNYSYPTSDHSLTGLAAGVEFWFRARIIDRTGNIGPWTDWTYGRSSVNSDELLSYLEGQIGAGELAPGLIEEIGDAVAPGIIETIKPEIIETVGEGIESNLIGFLTGDDENAPQDIMWYAGDDGSQSSFVGNKTITSAYNNEDYARSKQIFILASRVGENESLIARVDSTSASRDEALAQSITMLSAKVDDNTAKILFEQEARSTRCSHSERANRKGKCRQCVISTDIRTNGPSGR
ncbi:Phage-related protein, tail component [Vibrio cholerae]|nr:Phage-related protein, tail component [Vibrio cholerae]